MRITGTHIHYYFVCYTKLWLFHNRINMEQESDDVLFGKIIEDFVYKGVKKNHFFFDSISVDIIKFGNKYVIKEIKKSDKMLESSKYQLLYYIFKLRDKGLDVTKGVILIPKKFKTINIDWSESYDKEIKDIIKDIKNIVSGNIPKKNRKKICRRCAYSYFCWS